MFERHRPEDHPQGHRLRVLTLTALGVVYGDIGTSPLYAFKEAFLPDYGLTPDTLTVYGLLSMITWALILVVSVKYIFFVMRADNRGEGGIFALLALLLAQPLEGVRGRRRRLVMVALAIFGAALLYGDGIITPAISVLGAIEGLEVATPAFSRFVVIITVVILAVLFLFQKHGTERVGKVFGPIMAVWFVTIAGLGLWHILQRPEVLFALNPWYGVRFFMAHGVGGAIVLGAVVLAVTGAEALYADMGHFGRDPIRLAWFSLVLPSLVLNYFGQGALVLGDPAAATHNPFYLMAPRAMLYPLIAVATMAAIVASQALISGAFSLTQQAVQLGYSPRMTIAHTSKHEAGQIYVPEVNAALAIGCILVVLAFRSTTALSAAYGIAVTGTMAITSALYYVVMTTRFGWPKGRAVALTVAFFALDFAFLGANLVKIENGGWVPIAIAIGLFTLMTTWKRGRMELTAELNKRTLPLDMLLEDIERKKPVRVEGTAVFMTSSKTGVPLVLLHHMKHNKVFHRQVVLLSMLTGDVPEVPAEERVKVEAMGHGFFRVVATYGFMQNPDVNDVLKLAQKAGLVVRKNDTTFYLGRERIIPSGASTLAKWRKVIFIFLSRNARSPSEFFNIPTSRVVELGTQVEL
ncbi:MAG: potassium transporter Kup [Gemmatimonadetes bacterium]|nr:potassium transporter Kup [Gemmatimonadota bacterium]